MATEATTEQAPLNRKDFVTANDVRWCPGCGDYAILNALQRTFPELGIPREDFVVISGIGCSSRFPYYMETFGFHTIHGRAPAVATGVKVANPKLSVWIITGDGDGLSIGGNHLLHLMRRNVNVNVLLFNNRIYGLTKGQYSPTSEPGTRTKSTPMGSIDDPINPLRFALSAESSFVARTLDNNVKHMVETFTAAHAHRGLSFVEILQNCVIFNDKTWDPVYGKANRDEQILFLEEDQPLVFGKERDKGIRITQSLRPEVVTVGPGSASEAAILQHRPRDPGLLYPSMLAQLGGPDFPTAVGVLRAIERPTYEDQVDAQIDAAVAKRPPSPLQDLLQGDHYWTV